MSPALFSLVIALSAMFMVGGIVRSIKSHGRPHWIWYFAIALLGLSVGMKINAAGCGTHGGQCNQVSPAWGQPACTTAIGETIACSAPEAIRLWPTAITPGDTGRLPQSRDSTGLYQGMCVPFHGNGLERFASLTAEGGYLFVATNSGFSVWRLGADGAPVLVLSRDGWARGQGGGIIPSGAFSSFPPVSEQLNFHNDVSVLELQPGRFLFALAGTSPVGLSVWLFEGASLGQPADVIQLYQDTAVDLKRVGLVQNDVGVWILGSGQTVTTLWRVAAGSLAVSRVTALPHLGVWSAVAPSGPYVVHTGSNGITPVRVQKIDPVNGTAEPLPGGFGGGGRALAFVGAPSVGLRLALARGSFLEVLELQGAHPAVPVVRWPLRPGSAPGEEVIRVSEAQGRVVMLYGAISQAPALEGPAYERWVDITVPSRPVDLLAGGGTYLDPCASATSDYSSRMYAGTGQGPNNGVPGPCDAEGVGIYCAQGGMLTWHRWTPAPSDELFGDGFESGNASAWSVVWP